MTPVALVQVLADSEWVAVALQLCGGPETATAVTVTFCDGTNPWTGDEFVATPPKYLPLLSAAYCSSYVARLRRSDVIVATYVLSFVFANFGIAIAARMPMMTTTIRSSMSVNPFFLLISKYLCKEINRIESP